MLNPIYAILILLSLKNVLTLENCLVSIEKKFGLEQEFNDDIQDLISIHLSNKNACKNFINYLQLKLNESIDWSRWNHFDKERKRKIFSYLLPLLHNTDENILLKSDAFSKNIFKTIVEKPCPELFNEMLKLEKSLPVHFEDYLLNLTDRQCKNLIYLTENTTYNILRTNKDNWNQLTEENKQQAIRLIFPLVYINFRMENFDENLASLLENIEFVPNVFGQGMMINLTSNYTKTNNMDYKSWHLLIIFSLFFSLLCVAVILRIFIIPNMSILK